MSKKTGSLFEPVRFHLDQKIKLDIRSQLAKLMTQEGAIEINLDETPDRIGEVTHYMAESFDFRLYETLRPSNALSNYIDVAIVTPMWITKSFDLQTLQPVQFYSANPALLCSGLTFCVTDLSENDAQSLKSGVIALGGQWRKELTKEVTHLIALAPKSAKYEAALKYGPRTGMVVVLPHWFEQSIQLGQLINCDAYRWPDPPYLNQNLGTDGSEKHKTFPERLAQWYKSIEYSASSVDETTTARILGIRDGGNHRYMGSLQAEHLQPDGTLKTRTERETTLSLAPLEIINSHSNFNSNERSAGLPLPPIPDPAKEAIFKGKKVYLASDLGLREGLERALYARIVSAGGECWAWNLYREGEKGDDMVGSEKNSWSMVGVAEKELLSSDVVILRARVGWEFWTAYENNKTVANLSWIYFSITNSVFASPFDNLLHYPIPNEKISGFEDKTITISNYSGAARDYVRAMLELLGAKFDGAMSKTTSFVITASDYGAKVKHARSWEIPILNHFWLEDCIRRWKFINPASNERYSRSLLLNNPGVNLMNVVGTGAFSKETLEAWVKEHEADWLAIQHTRKDREADNMESQNHDTNGETIYPEKEQPKSHNGSKKRAASANGKQSEVESAAAEPKRKHRKTSKDPAIKTENPPSPKPKSRKNSREANTTKDQDSDSTSSSYAAYLAETASKRIDFYNEVPVIGRRGAATAAAQKLKAQMPDANKFAMELKHSSTRKKRRESHRRDSDNEDAEGDDEGLSLVTPKREEGSEEETTKRKNSKGKQKQESHDEVPGAPKKRNAPQLVPTPPLAAIGISSFEKPPNAASHKLQTKAASETPVQVKILTTGLGLDKSSPDIKGMLKLGAKWTETPAQVTHLVVDKLSRTEKFLSCLAFAPKIVTKAWLKDSIKAKRILEEEPYFLKDTTKEKELDDTLEDILARARRGKVFDGYTIFVTPSVQPDVAVLKRVITCGGGEVSTAAINTKAAEATITSEPNVFLVSCLKDRHKWEKLQSGRGLSRRTPVYSVEAVFQSMIHQELRFGENHRIDLQLS